VSRRSTSTSSWPATMITRVLPFRTFGRSCFRRRSLSSGLDVTARLDDAAVPDADEVHAADTGGRKRTGHVPQPTGRARNPAGRVLGRRIGRLLPGLDTAGVRVSIVPCDDCLLGRSQMSLDDRRSRPRVRLLEQVCLLRGCSTNCSSALIKYFS
jgi:hypothetical protein